NLRVARQRRRPSSIGSRGLKRFMGGRRTAPEDDQADEERERRHPDRGLDRGRPTLVARPRASHGAVTCSTGTVALCVMRTFQPGMTLRLKPLTVTVAVVAVRFA